MPCLSQTHKDTAVTSIVTLLIILDIHSLCSSISASASPVPVGLVQTHSQTSSGFFARDENDFPMLLKTPGFGVILIAYRMY